jgi:hypothetical protein
MFDNMQVLAWLLIYCGVILYIKATVVSVCLSVRAVSRHCTDSQTDTTVVLFSVTIITQLTGGANTGGGGGGGRARGASMGGEGPGGGKRDNCIMHQVHTSGV